MWWFCSGLRLEGDDVWEHSPESLLAGSPSLAPLSVLGRVSAAELGEIGRRFHERVQELAPDRRGELRTAAFVLAGLRFPPDLISSALRRIPEMRESSTYQLLVAEGRRMLLLLGAKRFGAPTEVAIKRIEDEANLEVLEGWALRLLEAESWEELFT